MLGESLEEKDERRGGFSISGGMLDPLTNSMKQSPS
jgi:hypothetical protein